MAGLCPAFSFCLIEGRSSGTAGFIESRPSSVNRFPVEGRRQADRDELFRCMDCSWLQREGVDRNGKSFLTTLLISVVIGVLVIYHVTPEG
jgi:hypothetical protein